eukprot:8192053-Lingulodinium_polyedra.AAC.1
MAAIFIDVASVFYSVLSQLAVSVVCSDEGIVYLLAALKLPACSVERLRARLLEAPALEAAG